VLLLEAKNLKDMVCLMHILKPCAANLTAA
jgi:hypothetical protein